MHRISIISVGSRQSTLNQLCIFSMRHSHTSARRHKFHNDCYDPIYLSIICNAFAIPTRVTHMVIFVFTSFVLSIISTASIVLLSVKLLVQQRDIHSKGKNTVKFTRVFDLKKIVLPSSYCFVIVISFTERLVPLQESERAFSKLVLPQTITMLNFDFLTYASSVQGVTIKLGYSLAFESLN